MYTHHPHCQVLCHRTASQKRSLLHPDKKSYTPAGCYVANSKRGHRQHANDAKIFKKNYRNLITQFWVKCLFSVSFTGTMVMELAQRNFVTSHLTYITDHSGNKSLQDPAFQLT